MERDSLGSLVPQPKSSSTTTQLPALDARVLGEAFERLADSEAVNQALLRLVAVYGEPWGRNALLAKQMAAEWEAALNDLPSVTITHAVSTWLRRESKWPRPADIRRIADDVVETRVSAVADAKGIHPRRINPSDLMKAFVFRRSPLRANKTWAAFLDSIHPTAEHCFFVEPEMGQYAHELHNATSFEAQYIREHWGEKLSAAFGQPILFVRPWRQPK